jgi:hypothetical protein
MLPDLPKKNKKKEASDGLEFREWFFKQKSMPVGDYELKDSRGKNYISFNEITEEQENSAKRTMSAKGNLTRVVVGTPGTADYIYRKYNQSFFVITYPKGTEVISLENLLFEKEKGKKSLTYDRAKAISTWSY